VETFRHYLDTHIDYWLDENEQLLGPVEVRYGYHYSGVHHLREQVVQVPVTGMSTAESDRLIAVYQILKGRIPAPKPVRLPHAIVAPRIKTGGLTFVAQDQRQAAILPVARLYYYEIVPELASQIERQVRLTREDWSPDEAVVARRLRAWIRAVAWRAYVVLAGPYLRS